MKRPKNYSIENIAEVQKKFKDNPHVMERFHDGNCAKCNAQIKLLQESHENAIIMKDNTIFHLCDECLGIKVKHTTPLDVQTHLETDLKGLVDGKEPEKKEIKKEKKDG